MVAELATQGALEMVQRITISPLAMPVNPVVGSDGLVMVAVPLTTDQAPVPMVGVLPARVVVVLQMVCVGPALAVVGLSFLVMITVSRLGVQVPLVMVHMKELAPADNAEKPLLGAVGLVMVAVPESRVHKPVPETGVLPEKLPAVPQMDWSKPAFAVVGVV